MPVAVGEHDFLTHPFDGGAPHVHGDNGIGEVELPASERLPEDEDAAHMLIRLSHEHPGTLEVITVGPLTNIATALALDPTLPSRVKNLTAMGGAALVPGNITPVAEANIGNDPEAASATLAAGWPVVLVPLDVTMENVFDEDDRAALLAADVPLARTVGEMLDFYFDFYVETYGERSSALHDRSRRRSQSVGSRRRMPPPSPSPWTPPRARAAVRSSATCAASAEDRSISPAPRCAWCSRRTHRSHRTSSPA